VNLASLSIEIGGDLRSEGPALDSPAREGGDTIFIRLQRPEGPILILPHLRRSDNYLASAPPLRTGLLIIGPSDLKVRNEPVRISFTVKGNRYKLLRL